MYFSDYGFLRTWTNIKVVLMNYSWFYYQYIFPRNCNCMHFVIHVLGVPTTESITFCPYIKHGLCELETIITLINNCKKFDSVVFSYFFIVFIAWCIMPDICRPEIQDYGII